MNNILKRIALLLLYYTYFYSTTVLAKFEAPVCVKVKSTTPHLSRAPTSISRLEKRAARRHDPGIAAQ